MGKYKLPSYPSKNQDAKNDKIMEFFRKSKEAGNNVPTVSIFNLDNVPSVIPDYKKGGKK